MDPGGRPGKCTVQSRVRFFSYWVIARSEEIQSGVKMKIAVAILCLVGLSAIASGQDNTAANHAIAPSVGLQVGERVPAFALHDQFGHECTSESLKGSKGTVLLFFRSADW